MINQICGPFEVIEKIKDSTSYLVKCVICDSKKTYAQPVLKRASNGFYKSCGCLKKSGIYNTKDFRVLKLTKDNKFLLKCKRCNTIYSSTVEEVRSSSVNICKCESKPLRNESNLEGAKFGKLTVISELNRNKKFILWNTICDCGETRLVKQEDLMNETVYSCVLCAGEKNIRKKLRKVKNIRKS